MIICCVDCDKRQELGDGKKGFRLGICGSCKAKRLR